MNADKFKVKWEETQKSLKLTYEEERHRDQEEWLLSINSLLSIFFILVYGNNMDYI